MTDNRPDNARTGNDAAGPRQGVAAVIVQEGRLLVIQRSSLVVAPGAFCFPGGAIEPGESETDALIREIREELGVPIRPHRRLWTSVTPWQVLLAWWSAELAAGAELSPNPAEVAATRWCTLEEMAALPDLLESNRHFLAAVASGEITLPTML
jgi:8-oxo-dGTP diphosphatase